MQIIALIITDYRKKYKVTIQAHGFKGLDFFIEKILYWHIYCLLYKVR